MPEPLRRDVWLLGQVLAEDSGLGLLEDIERQQRAVIEPRYDASPEHGAELLALDRAVAGRAPRHLRLRSGEPA